MRSHYFPQQRPSVSFCPVTFYPSPPTSFLSCSYWKLPMLKEKQILIPPKLPTWFALLLFPSSRSMVKTRILPLAPASWPTQATPPTPSFGPAHPSQHFQSNGHKPQLSLRWVFHTKKCKYPKQNLWKRNSVETSSSFPRSSSSSKMPQGLDVRGGAPKRRVWLCASSKPQGGEGNQTLRTEDPNPSYSLLVSW